MSYEKDKLDSYVTSASLSTLLGTYITSNSSSAAIATAIAGINLAPYVTSNSLSAAVATDTLTVRGTAAVSATLSAGRVTVAGRPVSDVVLGYATISGNAPVIGFSGSWSDFCMLQLRVVYRGVGVAGATTPGLDIYSDGGTTSILRLQFATLSLSNAVMYNIDIYGVNGVATKGIAALHMNPVLFTSGSTATANNSVLNCIRFATSASVTAGMAILTGVRNA